MNDATDTIDHHDEPAPNEWIDDESDAAVEPPDTPRVAASGRRAWISGIIAAGVALGIGEFLSGLSTKVPSLVRRVGDLVIENVPGSVERWAIETLGTNDKPALVAGIVVISLLIGAATGVATSKNTRTGAVVFAAFGLIGALATSSDPLRSPGWGWFVAIFSALAGAATLYGLLGTSPMGRRGGTARAEAGRRTFLGFASTAAIVALGAAVTGTLLRRRQDAAAESGRIEAAQALDGASPSGGAGSSQSSPLATVETLDSVDGISLLITPNDDFYRIDTALSTPKIDVDTWTMKITGMVDNELEFSFDDLLAMDPVEEFVTLSCVSNRVGGDLVGNAHWLGVPIKRLLDMAGVQPGATQIVGRSVDGWTGGFPTEYLDDPDRVALVAVAMNGAPLPIEHGFPVRLVVAGLYGYVSATKWLKEIELTTLEDFDGYWIPRGWSKLGPVKTQSRIDVPAGNARLTAGNQAIAGVAWAPDRGIAKVEVLVTPIINGEPVPSDEWIEAELSGDLSTNAWRQWFVPWEAPAGDHVIMVRATDGAGETQTSERTDVAPNGATGWHTIAVRVA